MPLDSLQDESGGILFLIGKIRTETHIYMDKKEKCHSHYICLLFHYFKIKAPSKELSPRKIK